MTNLALYSASSSALCRGSAAPVADARDKPEHDERGVGRSASSLSPSPVGDSVRVAWEALTSYKSASSW
ncbi:hypothetical protein GFL51_03495 [Rhizobium leguminosarum bv. viciae]|nr:hypothetical protein [Rhizobium leguminosarum bv. viciae]